MIDDRELAGEELEPEEPETSGVDDVPPAGRPAASSGTPPPIAVSDRVVAIGKTGSGKSRLLAHLFAIHGGQRLLVDVNDAYALGPGALEDPGGACYTETLRELDWRRRTIHYVPRSQSQRTYDDLYAAIWERAGQLLAQAGSALCVWLDEAQGPTSGNQAPRWLRTAITQGRKRRILHLAATQEPVNVLPVVYSQAEHLCLFELGGRPDDLKVLSYRLGMGARELALELERLPKYGYLRHTLGDDRIYAMEPLPAGVLAASERQVVWPA